MSYVPNNMSPMQSQSVVNTVHNSNTSSMNYGGQPGTMSNGGGPTIRNTMRGAHAPTYPTPPHSNSTPHAGPIGAYNGTGVGGGPNGMGPTRMNVSVNGVGGRNTVNGPGSQTNFDGSSIQGNGNYMPAMSNHQNQQMYQTNTSSGPQMSQYTNSRNNVMNYNQHSPIPGNPTPPLTPASGMQQPYGADVKPSYVNANGTMGSNTMIDMKPHPNQLVPHPNQLASHPNHLVPTTHTPHSRVISDRYQKKQPLTMQQQQQQQHQQQQPPPQQPQQVPQPQQDDELRLTLALKDMTILPPFRLEHNNSTSRVNFDLKPEFYQNIVSRPDLDLQLKCFLHDDIHATPNWPRTGTVHISVNNYPMSIDTSSCKALYIKHAIIAEQNTLEITVSACCCSHLFTLQVVHRPPVKTVINDLLKKKSIDHNICIQRIKRHFSNHHRSQSINGNTTPITPDDCSSVEQTAVKVSLRCPISHQMMQHPARGSGCPHLQCFDLKSYLIMNAERPSWKCPICTEPATLETLEIDNYMSYIINNVNHPSTSEVDEVTIDSNANWKMFVHNKMVGDINLKEEPGSIRSHCMNTGGGGGGTKRFKAMSPNNTSMPTSNSWEMGQGLSSYQSLAGIPELQDGSPYNFHPSSDFSSLSHIPNSSSTNIPTSSANTQSSLAPTMNGSALDPIAAMEKTLSQHDFGSHHDNISNINSINHKSPQNQMMSGSSSNLNQSQQGRANGNKNPLHQTGQQQQQQQNIPPQQNRSQSNQNQPTNMNCSSSSSPHTSTVTNCSPNGSINQANGHGPNGPMSNMNGNGNTNSNSMTNMPGGPHTPHTPLTPHTPHTPSNMGPPSVSNSNGSNSVNNSYTGPSNSLSNADLGDLNFDPAAVIEGEGQGQEGLNVSFSIGSNSL